MKFSGMLGGDRAPTLFLGQAGVYRVASECLLRGIDVSIPAVDLGVDLMTETGKRLQVKAASLHKRKQASYKKDGSPCFVGPAYFFNFSWNQGGAQHKARRRPRTYSSEIDAMILWGVDEDRFWICPPSIFDGRQGLVLFPGRSYAKISQAVPFSALVYQHEDNWDLIREEISVESEVPKLELMEK